jgi:two-component system, NarL family, nitrate/nitrite response regulator NarL
MTAKIRLLIIDDHVLIRRGLCALLSQYPDLCIAGEAGDANEGQRAAETLQPDVILLDNHMPGVSGVDALPSLRTIAPRARILMLTVSEDADDLAAALRAGAAGFLLKTIDGDELAFAIRRVLRGESVVSPEMTDKLINAFRLAGQPVTRDAAVEPTALDCLSPREHEILRCIADGCSNKEIARALDIAETTVKIHVQHILRKLKLDSRVQAAVLLTSQGARVGAGD